MQRQVINRPNPAKTETGEAAAAPIHESSASFAKGAGHGVARADRGVGRVRGEVAETTDVG